MVLILMTAGVDICIVASLTVNAIYDVMLNGLQNTSDTPSIPGPREMRFEARSLSLLVSPHFDLVMVRILQC
jgi:hypothetical protein